MPSLEVWAALVFWRLSGFSMPSPDRSCPCLLYHEGNNIHEASPDATGMSTSFHCTMRNNVVESEQESCIIHPGKLLGIISKREDYDDFLPQVVNNP